MRKDISFTVIVNLLKAGVDFLGDAHFQKYFFYQQCFAPPPPENVQVISITTILTEIGIKYISSS